MPNKEDIIKSCAKSWILMDRYAHNHPYKMRSFSDELIMPSKRQLSEWRISTKVKKCIKDGNLGIEGDLRIWTPSFISGIKDAGVFYGNLCHCFYIHSRLHAHIINDIKESKLPHKISKVKKNWVCNINDACFLEYSGPFNGCEYLAGLFAGSRIVDDGKDQWLTVCWGKVARESMALIKAKEVLDQWKIVYKEEKGVLYISPFYGALFFGHMGIHSASRILGIERPSLCPILPYLYWNICIRKKGEQVAPPSKWVLPFSMSYSSHWECGIVDEEEDIRKRGLEAGILGVSEELRNLLKEWVKYNSLKKGALNENNVE